MDITIDLSGPNTAAANSAIAASTAQQAAQNAMGAAGLVQSALAGVPTSYHVDDAAYFADFTARLNANGQDAARLVQLALNALFTVPLDGNGQPLYRDGNGNPQTRADHVTSTAAAAAKAAGMDAPTCDALTNAGAGCNVPGPAYQGALNAFATMLGH